MDTATGALLLKGRTTDGRQVLAIDLASREAVRFPDDLWFCARDGKWAVTSGTRHAGRRPEVVTEGSRRELTVPSASGALPGGVQLRAGAILADDLIGFPISPEAPEDRLKFAMIDVSDGTAEIHPWPGPSHVDYCGDAHQIFYATRQGEIYRLTPGERTVTYVTRGRMPALSAAGDLAFVSEGRRNILILRPGADAPVAMVRPRVTVRSVAWSPDGRWLAYQYELGIFGLDSRTGDVFGVGLFDMASERHYLLVPGSFSGIEVSGAARSGAIQWTSALPPNPLSENGGPPKSEM